MQQGQGVHCWNPARCHCHRHLLPRGEAPLEPPWCIWPQVAEIVDRAQKEEKMESGLAKLDDTWGRVAFNFAPHKEGSDVSIVKMAEEDFEVGPGRGCRAGVRGLQRTIWAAVHESLMAPSTTQRTPTPHRCLRTTRCWSRA